MRRAFFSRLRERGAQPTIPDCAATTRAGDAAESRGVRKGFRPWGKTSWLTSIDETANYVLPISRQRPRTFPRQRKRDRDRAERVRLVGGPEPSLRDKACAFARQRTIARTRDFTALGIPRSYLALMCAEGLLIRIGHGRYRAAEHAAHAAPCSP